MEQAQMEEEGAMADLIDELFQSANQSAQDSNSDIPISLNVNMSGDNIAKGRMFDESNDAIDEIEDNNEDKNVNDMQSETEHETSAIVGSTGKKLNTCLTPINKICFIDLKTVGREMIEKANPMMTLNKKRKKH